MKIIGIIPARYNSSRFPGKPLADINGKPMIWWVYKRAVDAGRFDNIYVATEDNRIVDYCNKYGISSIMTSSEHKNGTERVSEVAKQIDADIYITIQGDEPLIEPDNINKIIDLMIQDASIQCATLKTPYENPVDVINGTTPKVVSNLNDNVMLFTRSPVPYPKSSINYIIYKPMGLYGFRKEALELYSNLIIGPVEKAEDIELLRFIENGYNVRIIETKSNTVAVDTPKDLDKVRMIIDDKYSLFREEREREREREITH